MSFLKGAFSGGIGVLIFLLCLNTLGFAMIPSVCFGFFSFAVMALITKGNSKKTKKLVDGKQKNSQLPIKETKHIQSESGKIVDEGRQQMGRLNSYTFKLKDREMVQRVKKLTEIMNKILQTASKRPEKADQLRAFLDYYLPVTIKILDNYNNFEHNTLTGPDAVNFMEKVKPLMNDIEKAFEKQLNSMYESDILDMETEIRVFREVLKNDSMLDD